MHVEAIRTILVPTDFSANADVAERWAVAIAAAHGATVLFLHVAPVQRRADLPGELRDRIEAALDERAARARAHRVEAKGTWRVGRPWREVAEASGTCDLLVVGARGHGRHLHLSLGGTADRILRTAAPPVLTVHADDTEPPGLPGRVLVPTDFTSATDRVLGLVALLCGGAGPVEVTLLHAWQPLLEYEYAFAAVDLSNPLLDSAEEAREQLRAAAARLGSDVLHVTPRLCQGQPAREIEAAAEDADLVAMGTHGRSGLERFMLGSVAERVVHRAPRPVLTVVARADG